MRAVGHIARLTGYALRHKAHFAGFMSAAAVATVFNLLTPLVLVRIIDTVVPSQKLALIVPHALLYLALIVGYALFDFVQRYLSALMAQHVIFELRAELYESLMSKDLAFYDENETGQLLARVTTDVTTMRQFLLWGYRVIFTGAVTLVGTYYVMFTLSPRLTMWMLLVLPALGYVIYAFAKRVRPVFFAARDQYGRLSAVLQENITGMKIVQSYSTLEHESKRVEQENRKYLDLIVEANRLANFYSPLLITVLGVATGALVYVGGLLYSFGDLSAGEFVGFVSLVAMLVLPARFLTWGVGMYQRASAAAERTFYILDARDEIMDPPDPVPVERLEGHVTFQHVFFSYRGDNYILRDINLDVRPGQVVALLGGTGSGKTSLVNLIPRFYDVDPDPTVTVRGRTYRVDRHGRVRIGDTEYRVEDGTLTIDGESFTVQPPGALLIDSVDVRRYSLDDLRRNIGMVHQDPFLFSASIRENIAFARPDAPMDEVIAAARAAMIHDFIVSLPGGYDTVVGERGVTLSGGQRQRIAIARALLADPRILILDDSTSSVDARTELEIQRALENVMRGRTTFIITHRLSTIRGADLIVMMERGRIVEVGTHEELMARGGLYADLYATLDVMREEARRLTAGQTAGLGGGTQ